MGGFATTIGFMFSFFAIMAVFIGTFISYQNQIIEQTQTLENYNKVTKDLFMTNFKISDYFRSSGRDNFYIKNNGKDKLIYTDKNKNTCFSFFRKEQFVNLNDVKISAIGTLDANYNFIDTNEKGSISLLEKNNQLNNGDSVKIISCSGIEQSIQINKNKSNWWNSDWNYRKNINIKNPSNNSIIEYQVEINLNNTNFNFNKLLKIEDLRFIVENNENKIIDLTFDEYSQNLKDYSKYNQNVILGTTTSEENNDPIKNKGILFNGLKFDGNDIITINNNNSLMYDKEVTIISWIKWNQSGDNYQVIYTSNENSNVLGIVNDGTINQNKIILRLNISGTQQYLYSNKTIDNKWHYIVGRYNSKEMEIFIDGIPSGKLNIEGEIIPTLTNNYIGSAGSSEYFIGEMDEIKVFNYALTNDEIINLKNNNLRFRELEYYISKYDKINNQIKIFVKIPYINANENISINMYYNNYNSKIKSHSDIEKTFSYKIPRKVGYVGLDTITNTNGLNIMSLYDNNEIIVGDDNFILNEQQGTTLAATNIDDNDIVKMKYLGQVEGNGNGDDMIIPSSWASKEFYFGGFRSSNDKFCMVSEFGNANVNIYDKGNLEWSGTVNKNIVNCISNDIESSSPVRISSDIPILVSYVGTTGQDSFIFYPATNKNLYGSPSKTLYLGSGPNGANVEILQSDGSSNSISLTSNKYYKKSNIGSGDGNANGFLIKSNNKIGAIQQADNDGTESTIFVPEKEFGTKFGSNEETDYISIVSTSGNANCSTYDNSGNLIDTISTVTGNNGIYKYEFGTGNDNSYLAGQWLLKCDKPVWPYYENRADSGDETNLFGHLQMRQYNYPEPIITIN